MWSSSRTVKVASVVFGLALLPVLSACSGLHPVYAPGQFTNEKIELAMSAPNNRVEQIIYQDLKLHFTQSKNPDAPKLTVSAGGGPVGLFNNTVTAAHTEAQATVSAAIVLTNAKGEVLFSGSRSQSADYTNGPQVLANNQAYGDAVTRAAHLVADSVRLSVLGALSK